MTARRPVLALATVLALVLGARGAARADEGPRTFAVVVDRSASLQYADPRGEARAALAFAMAFAARPTDSI